MKLEQLKELLETPEVKEALEAELKEAVATKQAELDEKLEALSEEKKKNKKQLFLIKKTLAAKSALYESKLKQYYEAKFTAATKQVADSVFDFINESVASLVKTIQEDVTNNTKSKKLEEAVSQVIKVLSPHANIAELVTNNTEATELLRKQLNNVMKENKLLKARTLSEDLDALLISECAGYPLDQTVLIRETLKKVSPQPTTLSEAKLVISKLKEAVRKQSVPKATVTESAAPKTDTATANRVTLRKIVEETKSVKPVEIKGEPVSALDYDITDV